MTIEGFHPVASLTNQPYVLVAATGCFTLFASLLPRDMKPGELKFGSTGPGTGHHTWHREIQLRSGKKGCGRCLPSRRMQSPMFSLPRSKGRTTYMIAPISIP